jgi:SAM-dependent methyltransferase
MNLHADRWEQIFASRQYETYWPFDSVVSFVFRHAPSDQPRSSVSVLELGFGLGNNLRFLAASGFKASGVDISQTAVDRARLLLEAEGLQADLRLSSADALPFDDDSFDLVVDRGCLTVLPDPVFTGAVAEAWRVLRPEGKMMCTPFADLHSSNALTNPVIDGLTEQITTGGLETRDRGVRFVSYSELRSLFAAGWRWVGLTLDEQTDFLSPARTTSATWIAIVQKVRQPA